MRLCESALCPVCGIHRRQGDHRKCLAEKLTGSRKASKHPVKRAAKYWENYGKRVADSENQLDDLLYKD